VTLQIFIAVALRIWLTLSVLSLHVLMMGCHVVASAWIVVSVSASVLLIVASVSLGMVVLERGVKAVLKDGMQGG